MTRIQLRRTGQTLAGCSALLIAFAGILWTQFHPSSVSAREAAGSSVLYVSHVRVNEGWQTTLNLTNLESYPIKTTITAYDQKGGLLGDVIAMAGVEETQTIAIDAATLPWGTAAVKIEAEGRLAANAVLRSADGAQAEALPAIAATSGRLDFPLLGKSEMSRQTITLFNPNAATANLEIVAFDRTGYELGRRTLESLGATESRQIVLSEIIAAPGADVDKGERIRKPMGALSRAASVSLTSDQPLVGTQLVEASGADIAALPALTASRDLTFYMPSLNGARELSASVLLFNPGDQAATVSVEAFDAGANSLGQVAERSLAPNATESLRPGSLPEQTAALKVKADRAISGYELIGVANSQGRTALPGITAEDQITTGYELIGSSDDNTLEAYPLLKLSDGSVRAGYARAGADMWAERLGPAGGEAQTESAAAPAAVAPPATFSASGRLLTATGGVFRLAGVTMTFTLDSGSGAIPAPAQTNANGEWSQTGFIPGTIYRVTPSAAAYSLAPAYLNFSADNKELNFIARPFTVSGRVTDSSGNGVGLVKLTFTLKSSNGAVPAQVTTDANGAWSQTGFTGGAEYRVTPSHPKHVFTPGYIDFNTITGALSFTAQKPFGVSGRLLTASGAPLRQAGLTITFTSTSGSGLTPASAQTNVNGEWSQTGFTPGTIYRVIPSVTGYALTPAWLEFSAASAELNFTAQPFTVSGRVTIGNGIGIGAVTLTFALNNGNGAVPAQVTTDANGAWSQTGFTSGASYRVTPSKPTYVFTPGSIEFDTGATAISFTAQRPFRVSGRLLTASGAPLRQAGATITFTSTSGSGLTPAPVQTNVNGVWSQTGFTPGTSYIAVPSVAGYALTPAHLEFSAASTELNFTTQPFTVSGRVTDNRGRGVEFVKLTFTSLSGQAATPVPVTTDANGDWNQTGFTGGALYHVTPIHPSFAFSPQTTQFNSVSTTLNFTAQKPFGVSGRLLTASGAPFRQAGVTMTFLCLSGPAPTLFPAQTNANGEWSQTGFATGAIYSVIPSIAGYVFSPEILDFDAATTELNFKVAPFTVSGRVTDSGGKGVGGVTLAFNLSSGGSAVPPSVTTDVNGNWSQTGFTTREVYYVRPSHPSYAFTPNAAQFFAPSATLNFMAEKPFSVSGRLLTASGGPFRQAGITLTFTSEEGFGSIPAPTQTNANGEWSQTGFAPGTTYVVRPSIPGNATTPVRLLFSAERSELNFTAQPYIVSGRVTDSGGKGVRGATLTFHVGFGAGALPAPVITDANGNWSQTSFTSGAGYTVVVSHPNYTFQVNWLTFETVNTALNFTAQ